MPRNCPDCQIELVRKDFEGLELDTCPRCAGVYFDDGELAELRRRGDQAMAILDEQVQPTADSGGRPHDRLRVCPGCGAGMSKFRYLYSSPVLLDSCEDCGGIWIDNGELKAMQEYLRAEMGVRQGVIAQVPPSAVTGDRAKIAARAARYLANRPR